MTGRLGAWGERLLSVPASGYFGLFVFLSGALVALAHVAPVRRRLLEPALWRPMVEGTGYNAFNTALLLLTFAILLLWFLRILRAYDERMDAEVVVAILPFLVWGPLLRALEDSDLFAPFGEGIRTHQPRLPPTAPCALDVPGSFLDQCLGIFFVTPPIWILLCLLLFLAARTGLLATQIGRRRGRSAGLAFFAATLAALLLLHAWAWASPPSWVRFVPSPILTTPAALLGFALVAWDARKNGQVRWRRALLAYGLLPTALAIHYVAVWLQGGVDGWRPQATHAWVLAAVVLAPALLGFALWLHARDLASGPRRAPLHRATALWLLYVLVVEAWLAYGGLERIARGMEGEGAGVAATGILLPLGGVAAGAWILRGLRRHRLFAQSAFRLYADPVNVLVVASQLADALMTALALEAYGGAELHLVPRALIAAIDATGAPDAAFLVMVLYKLPLVLAFLWAVDRRWSLVSGAARDLAILLKVGVLAVGAVPALRDALRMAMGV